MNKVILLSLLIVCLACPTKKTKHNLSCDVCNLRKKECGYYGITQNACEKIGCCWKEVCNRNIPWCFYGKDDPGATEKIDDSCVIDKELREPCGQYGIDKKECEAKGCCWKVDADNSIVPWCFQSLKSQTPEKQEDQSASIIFDPA